MKDQVSKISAEQKQLIVEFMEQNTDFARGTALKVKNRPTYNELWNQLTLILNKTPGPKKDKIKWQKVWSGIKKGIKMKLKKVQIYDDKKTGQYIFYPKLTDIDERIIAIIKNKDKDSTEVINHKKNEENKIKNEISQNKIYLHKTHQPSSLMEQIIFSDDDEGNSEETAYEDCSNLSWNSHDNRSTNKNENTISAVLLREKVDAISLQLEHLIEQNSVSNILLERIATTLENRNQHT